MRWVCDYMRKYNTSVQLCVTNACKSNVTFKHSNAVIIIVCVTDVCKYNTTSNVVTSLSLHAVILLVFY